MLQSQKLFFLALLTCSVNIKSSAEVSFSKTVYYKYLRNKQYENTTACHRLVRGA